MQSWYMCLLWKSGNEGVQWWMGRSMFLFNLIHFKYVPAKYEA
jgi:hypothetical protein